jgi:Lipoprotein signal peptidase
MAASYNLNCTSTLFQLFMRLSKTTTISILTIFLILVCDQTLKLFIKSHFELGHDVQIFGWFHIYFIENNGMAFGMELFGKLFLSLFRIGAGIFLVYYLRKIIKRQLPTGYIVSISLIFAGAVGNLLDSMFYGLLFSDSMGQVAQFMPESGGYASLFYGKVVDMLYFPLIEGNFPDWFPVWGGEDFIFFRPVFNIADSAVSVGVVLILLFYRRYLSDNELENQTDLKPEEKA